MADTPLAGCRVLVTRPKAQGQGLVEAIGAAGGSAVVFPVMEAHGRDPADIASDTGRLSDPDIVIFVSANAVRFGLASAGSGKVAAIGPATTRAIEQRGVAVGIRSADGFTSEHLLATPELLDVQGKVIRIIRGNGGRELMAQTLRDRGATVEYLEVYSRHLPAHTEAEISDVEQQLVRGEIDVVTLMSVESLLNLIALLPSTTYPAIANTLLVTPAIRVIKEAEGRFPGILTTLAEGPQARDIVAAIATRTNPGHPDD
jgi:uroporphyrinogen-III synthase